MRSHDEKDTVADSLYPVLRSGLPADDPERDALDKALAHAGTATVAHLDPYVREVREVGTDGEVDLVQDRLLDAAGAEAGVVDARPLTVLTRVRDLHGRVLRSVSVDAGTS